MYHNGQGRIQGGGGGLRVLKHPPKLPKINYLLFNIVNLLSEFRYYQLNNSIIQHPSVSLNEAKDLELQDRCCSAQHLSSYYSYNSRSSKARACARACAEITPKVGVAHKISHALP